MKKALIRAVVGIVFSAACGSSFAADLPRKAAPYAPAVVPAATWTGFYLGGSLGGRWSNVDITTISVGGAAPAANNTASLDSSTFRGGLYGGYNWQFAPTWVVGIEGDYAWGDSSELLARLPGAAVTNAGDSTEAKQKWDANLLGRLGYLFAPNIMVYATGGASWIGVEANSICSAATCGTALTSSLSTTRSGWTIGGGVEWAITRNWLARAEYRYADYGTWRQTSFAGTVASSVFDTTMTTQTALAGLAYKF